MRGWITVGSVLVCSGSVLGAQSNEAALRISPEAAVSLALANNLNLEAARRGPDVAEWNVRAAEGVWMPTLGVLSDRQLSSDVSVTQRLPWGASYEAGWSSDSELSAVTTARITQPLLRGFSIDAARADRTRSLQARDRAGFELDGTMTGLKRGVLYAYWQWVYARALRAVADDALRLAQNLLDGNRRRVAARAMAAADVIEAEAEVARRGEAVIVADKEVLNAEDRLRLLILNPGAKNFRTPLEPLDGAEEAAPASGDPVARALVERSDLKALRSALETASVNVRQFTNDVLPSVDVSASVSAPERIRYPAWSVQVAIAYPIGQAVARATAARAQVERRQTQLLLAALEQRVATEVRTAQREVETNDRRLQSTATAVALAERRLAAEEQKFLVGLSTSFFVFQGQRDLASARVAQLGAVLDRRLSVADLEALQGAPLTPPR